MVNTMMPPSDMAYVPILDDVPVIIHAQETNNRHVEEIELSPYIQSVSRLTVNRVCKLKQGAVLSGVHHLMLIGKIPHFLQF